MRATTGLMPTQDLPVLGGMLAGRLIKMPRDRYRKTWSAKEGLAASWALLSWETHTRRAEALIQGRQGSAR